LNNNNSIEVWEIIDSGSRTGQYNMDFDLELVEKCRQTGQKFLRFYRWEPYAISLGYNQQKVKTGKKINAEKCREDNIDIVERPTGGRAILHSEEITYSVVMKTDIPVKEIYNDISSALVTGLKKIDTSNELLQKLSLTQETPDLLKLMKTGMYNLCFASAVKYEINLHGKKLVGSAQRRMGDVMLQHGSILLGEHHKKIVDYLNYDYESEMEKLRNELNSKTICINEILGRTVTYEEVRDNLLCGFEETLFQTA
jgi:lipoate-protein ligase A